MKVRVYKLEDGSYAVLCKKTRPHESHSILTRGVKKENLTSEIEKAIRAARGDVTPQPLF